MSSRPPVTKTPQNPAKEPLWQAIARGRDVVYDWDLEAESVAWCDDLSALLAPGTQFTRTGATAFSSAILPEDLARRQDAVRAARTSGEGFNIDYRVGREGDAFWVNERGRVEAAANGQPRRLLGVMHTVESRKERESQLERIAHFDELTGHATRFALRAALDKALAGTEAGYLLLSIDNPARIRAAYGREATEALVLEVGRRIAARVRGVDTIGRVDQYQFGVLVAKSSESQLAGLAARLLEGVRGAVVKTAAGPIPTTASVGGVLLASGIDAETAMAHAEEALGDAKRAGRDRYRFYDGDQTRIEERDHNRQVAGAVMAALEADRMCLAYQPVIEAATGRVVQYESLMRMMSADGQPVPAAHFMPSVEKLGLARLIDRKALTLAMSELAQFPGLRLAVNVSALTAADAIWFGTLEELVDGRRDLAERLTIEITETAAFYSFATTANFVSALRALGCSVALDDFGVGHTSFRHLRGLDINVVKIDGSFARELMDREENRLVVRAVVDLARGLGLTTVAEGVESGEDARILIDQGVDYLQGYHFGRPVLDRPWRQPPVPLRLVPAAPPGKIPAAS